MQKLCGIFRLSDTRKMGLVLAGLAIASVGLAQSQAAPPMHEIPLLSCSGAPCVELTSGKVNVMRLVIDLGSVHAYLNLDAAQKRQLRIIPLSGASGGSISAVQQTVVPGAKLGDLQLGDFPFMVLDLASDQNTGKKKDISFPADGALAFGSFENRRVQIDWSKHVLRVSDPLLDTLPCPRDCRDLKSEPFGAYGPRTLVADGFEIAGKPVRAQIDTLFGGTMLLYPKAGETVDVGQVQKSKHKEEFPFMQGGLKLTRAIAVDYTFDKDALLTDAPVFFWSDKENAAPDVSFDATVGTALLSRALFTFDFRSWKIWMEPAATEQ